MHDPAPQSVISATLDSHALWLKDDPKGERADLVGAYLYGANLEGANLKRAYLYEANLYKANLEGANLDGANLNGANLYGANLEGSNVKNTIITAFKHDVYNVIFQRNENETLLYYGCEKHPIKYWLENVKALTLKHIGFARADKKVEEILNLIKEHSPNSIKEYNATH